MQAEPWFERIGPNDVQQLVTDVGPVPANVGALLLLDARAGADAAGLCEVLADRLARLPRLGQRLMSAPRGGGRPVWVDDPTFQAERHVGAVTCPAPGDQAALLDLAAALVSRPLDRSGPLWRAWVVSGLGDDRLAMVLSLHHVVADGLGGLAILGELVDGASPGGAPGPGNAGSRRLDGRPRPEPTGTQLRRDAWRQRARAIPRLPRAMAGIAPALGELGRSRPGRAPRTSLNVPTGPRRRAVAIDVPLAPLRSGARSRGATVTDALLAAVGGALGDLLARRGEHVESLVVSVPVSARPSASADRLGNQVGVMAVRVPTAGPISTRIQRIATSTAEHKAQQRGSSAALVAPAFRALAAMGLFRWMIDHQRLVNAFLTSMPGPDRPLALAGMPIRRIVPVTIATGNVAVAFAALSYAGTMTVTAIADPDLVPELDRLAAWLEGELRCLADGTPHPG